MRYGRGVGWSSRWVLDDFEEVAEGGFGGEFGMDEEDDGAVRAGAWGRVDEVVAFGFKVGVCGVDIGDFKGEMGEGGSVFKELTGDGAIRGEGGQELKRGLEEDFADLVRS